MGKNIVLCSDGTGNASVKGRGTNVWKLYEAIDFSLHRRAPDEGNPEGDRCEQIAFYDDGVGTSGFKPLKLMGGAFGYGLKRNVLDLYESLCRIYEPGDRIYLFGFSRGAYTVRFLAGLISCCGIVDRARWDNLSELRRISLRGYKSFRHHFHGLSRKENKKEEIEEKIETSLDNDNEDREAKLRSNLNKMERDIGSARKKAEKVTNSFFSDYSTGNGSIEIEFIGVWDTVAAIGLPVRELTSMLNKIIPFQFPDRLLGENIKKGCHALSIDDERNSFHPILWEETEKDRASGRIEQVWFPGVHSNVGGGYPKQGISLVTLDWMMAKADEAGLRFFKSERSRYQSAQNCHDWHYDSRKGKGVYYRYKPRGIKQICEDANSIPPKIHVSTLERIASATQGYAPIVIPDEFVIVNYDSRLEERDEKKIELLTDGLQCSAVYTSVENFIRFRRYSWSIFLTLTAGVLAYGTWYSNNPESSSVSKGKWVPDSVIAFLEKIAEEVPWIGGRVKDLLDPFFLSWQYSLAVAVTVALVSAVTIWSRRMIHKEASRFWRKQIYMPWTSLLATFGGEDSNDD